MSHFHFLLQNFVGPKLLYHEDENDSFLLHNYTDITQGTGFFLKNIGFITNAHVISKYATAFDKASKIDPIKIHQSNYDSKERYATLVKYCIKKDIALFNVEEVNRQNIGLKYSTDIKENMKIRVYGFPDYQKNNEMSISYGVIKRKRSSPVDNELRYETTAPILGGNSGGPVVNEFNEVVGIAVRGTQEYPNDIIPIYDILEYLIDYEKT